MPDPVIDEEVKVQTDMISDVLEGFIPSSTTTQLEVSADGKEGEERPAEVAGKQVETPVVTGKEEAKVVEPVVPQTPVVEAAPVTPVAPVAPVAVAPVVPETPAQPTEVESLRQQLADMRLAMEKMAGGPQAPAMAPVASQTPVPQAQPTQDQQMNLKQILRFLPDDATYDTVTKNAENFNILLTNVVNTAVQRSLQMLPQVATRLVDTQMTARTAVDEFYRANEDLLPFRKFVGFVTAEVAAAHADWALDDVLKESNKLSRERLKLPAIASGTPQQPVQAQTPAATTVAQNPAFVPGTANRGRRANAQVETPTGQEQQIIDILS